MEGASQRKRVLIIEDEPSLCQTLRQALETANFSVLEARDGVEGLDVSLREHPDLILLDIILPKMDGLTMAKKLREDPWGKDVPIIILTNLSVSENKESISAVTQAVEHGIYDYLVKADWRIEDVVRKVRERLAEMM